MKVSMEGMGEQVATFEAETEGAGAVTAGTAVKLSGSGKVCACTAEGDVPAGAALSVRNGYAAVQVAGYVKLPCAAGLAVGYQRLATDASGKLTAADAGRGALVTDVENGVCGVIL